MKEFLDSLVKNESITSFVVSRSTFLISSVTSVTVTFLKDAGFEDELFEFDVDHKDLVGSTTPPRSECM